MIREYLDNVLVWGLVIIAAIIILVATIIALPFWCLYEAFDFSRSKIYRHHIYMDTQKEQVLKECKDAAKIEYGYRFYVKRHVIELDPEPFVGHELLTGATFCFIRSKDAVHFKLLNLYT